ncbi:hypothetical protein [Kangiella marina]|uniref:Uncharacterized protein n=1 Tax=Kangiella marina TaxID=1079178 RepID=A0ABP8IPR8_9GAMM
MDKQQPVFNLATPSKGKAHSVSIIKIGEALIEMVYPYNVELTPELLMQQDKILDDQHNDYSYRLPSIVVHLDGVSDLLPETRNYMNSKQHQNRYKAVAYVLSSGNMAVLEKHYLEQLFFSQTRNAGSTSLHHYPIGIFKESTVAQRWLKSLAHAF